MSAGKQVRLFLADGTPGGLLTAEIMNWSGHVSAAPRSDVGELLKRIEARRTGVYVLLGDDPETSEPAAYIGEADDIGTRLRHHARSQEQGGKDFWDRVVILTSKDANLTKAHARYLESRLIELAGAARRATLVNGTAPSPLQLPEADVSDMEYFITQVLIVLPVLGVTIFRQSRPTRVGAGSTTPAERESPLFELAVPRQHIVAHAKEIDGEFTVLQGSIARDSWVGTDRHPGYSQLHASLINDGTIVPGDDSLWRFSRDVAFASPSAAGAVVTGRSCNGRTAWQTGAGLAFGAWQGRGISDPDYSDGSA